MVSTANVILERQGDQNKMTCYAWAQRVGMAWAHSRLLYMEERCFFACDWEMVLAVKENPTPPI